MQTKISITNEECSIPDQANLMTITTASKMKKHSRLNMTDQAFNKIAKYIELLLVFVMTAFLWKSMHSSNNTNKNMSDALGQDNKSWESMALHSNNMTENTRYFHTWHVVMQRNQKIIWANLIFSQFHMGFLGRGL